MADSIVKSINSNGVSEDADRERVCALAAVLAYIASEAHEKKGISDNNNSDISPWGMASLMEGTGIAPPLASAPSGSSKKNLWRSLLPVFLFLALVHTTISSASAQSQSTELDLSSNNSLLVGGNTSNFGQTANQTVYVRVGLAIGASKLEFDTFDGADIIDLSSGNLVGYVKPDGKFDISVNNVSGENAIAFSPKTYSDASLLVAGEDLSSIKRVSFTPRSIPRLPYVAKDQKKGFKGSLPTLLSVSVRPGVLPLEYMSGRSTPDLTTLSGVLIAPRDYTRGGSQSVFTLNGRAYRGALLIAPRAVSTAKGGSKLVLNAINLIDIEDYLLSVLPSEMPPSWPLEALKAQAIAARSYALANLGKYASSGFDIKATVQDQAYTGIAKELDRSNLAVVQTRGTIMKHENKVVPAFFHSSGGGYTEVSEHVWSSALPYLKSVKDFDHGSPHLSWKKSFSPDDLGAKLKLANGKVLGLFVLQRSPSNRVKELMVLSESGVTVLKGTQVRSLLGLPGTNFNISYNGPAYVIEGQGFGHGLGMSQWGAKELSEHGYNAGQILKYYYKDVTFGQIFEATRL